MSKIQLYGNQYFVIIPDSVLSLLKEFEQVDDKDEAGGILLGKITNRNDQIAIALTDITPPTKYDYRSRFRFIRKREPAQKIINEKWEDSNGKINYLGEWHTHPEYKPKPSFYDRKMIEKRNIKVKSDFDFTLMLIIGFEDSFWAGIREETELIELQTK